METQILLFLACLGLLMSYSAAALSSVFTSTPFNKAQGAVHKVPESENVPMVWEFQEASGESVETINWVIVNPTNPTNPDETIASVEPPSDVTFYNNLTGRAKFHGNASFELLNVRANDSLLYGCFLYFGLGKGFLRSHFKLEVQVGPNPDTKENTSVNCTVGEPCIVNCSATGIPTPTVIWSYQGTEITRGTGLATLNRTLTKDDINKTYTYECHAENDVKRILVKTVTLYLIYIGPNADNQGAVVEKNCLEGQACEVNCSATGIPTPTVLWFHEGTEITRGTGLATLSQTVTKADGNKTYECYAKNDVRRIHVKNVTLYLNIKEAPRVTLKPGNWSGEEGSTLVIECTATGFPKPTTTLKGPSGPLSNPHEFDVQKSDHGTVFNCTARNSVEEDSSWMKLNVTYKPSDTKLVSSSAGDKVLLTCTSDANPPVTNYTLYYQETCRSDKRMNLPTKDQCSWETDKHGFFHVIAENPFGEDISNVICVKCCLEEKETLTEEPSPFGPHWKELFIMLLALCAIFLLLAVILLVILCKWRRKFESGGETSFNLEKYENEAILNGGAPKNNQAKPESKEMGVINHTLEKETTQTTIVPEEMTRAENDKTKPAENNEKKPVLVGSGDTKAPVDQLGPPVHFPEGRHRMPSIETTTRGKRQEKA